MGDEDFDEQCVFGNNVQMTPSQVARIREQAKMKLHIPYYVCKMTWSNVIARKAKMVNIWDLTRKIFLCAHMLNFSTQQLTLIFSSSTFLPSTPMLTWTSICRWCFMSYAATGLVFVMFASSSAAMVFPRWQATGKRLLMPLESKMGICACSPSCTLRWMAWWVMLLAWSEGQKEYVMPVGCCRSSEIV